VGLKYQGMKFMFHMKAVHLKAKSMKSAAVWKFPSHSESKLSRYKPSLCPSGSDCKNELLF
jgi:hypothetical protein